MKERFDISCFLTFALSSFFSAFAQGIPEPPIIFYGSVIDNRTPVHALKTNGTLRVVLSSGAEQLTFTTALQPIDGNNSYILALPAETPVSGFSESPNYLRFRSSPLSYTLNDISLDGQKLYVQAAASGSFLMNADARGSVRPLNLLFAAPALEDSNGNGFADAWERQYFGTLGVDPNGDPDRDGKSNLQEFKDGTDPKERTFLDLTVLSATPGKVRLAWESKPGSNYSIERFDAVPLQTPINLQQGLAGQGQRMTFDIDVDPSGKQKFFRLKE